MVIVRTAAPEFIVSAVDFALFSPCHRYGHHPVPVLASAPNPFVDKREGGATATAVELGEYTGSGRMLVTAVEAVPSLAGPPDMVAQLCQLAELNAVGALDDVEYNRAKKKLLDMM